MVLKLTFRPRLVYEHWIVAGSIESRGIWRSWTTWRCFGSKATWVSFGFTLFCCCSLALGGRGTSPGQCESTRRLADGDQSRGTLRRGGAPMAPTDSHGIHGIIIDVRVLSYLLIAMASNLIAMASSLVPFLVVFIWMNVISKQVCKGNNQGLCSPLVSPTARKATIGTPGTWRPSATRVSNPFHLLKEHTRKDSWRRFCGPPKDREGPAKMEPGARASKPTSVA